MNIKTLSILSFILLTLTGCVADGILVPKKQGIQELHNIQVTYILPTDAAQASGSLNGLIFQRFNRGDSTKMENLCYSLTPTGIVVHRRTDNTVAGSGIVYDIDVNTSHKSDSSVVTLTPKTQRAYQEGLILPFPIPNFNIETYLSSATFYYQFEIDSNYNADSIKANFDRTLNSSSLELGDVWVDFNHKVYPYRNGSKVLISANIHSQRSKNGVIDMTYIIEELRQRMQSIINS